MVLIVGAFAYYCRQYDSIARKEETLLTSPATRASCWTYFST